MMTKKEYTSPEIYLREFPDPMCSLPIGGGSATVIGAKSCGSTSTIDEDIEDDKSTLHDEGSPKDW